VGWIGRSAKQADEPPVVAVTQAPVQAVPAAGGTPVVSATAPAAPAAPANQPRVVVPG
jgi:hypothetical protein